MLFGSTSTADYIVNHTKGPAGIDGSRDGIGVGYSAAIKEFMTDSSGPK
jgi:hypothetical protein